MIIPIETFQQMDLKHFRIHYINTGVLQNGPRSLYNQEIATFNSSAPVQNDHHFTDDTFKCIFVNEKFCISIKNSLKFVAKGPIDNNPAMVQIMAWRRIGDNPLSQPMPTRFTDEYMRQ